MRALLTAATLLAAVMLMSVTPVAAATASCGGAVATIVGTDKGDTIDGTKGPDVIAGLGGDDVIRGRGGGDVLCGGVGRDVLLGGDGRDRMYGNEGRDRLVGGPGADRLHGGAGNDHLSGRNGNDRLDGGPGTDTCVQDSGTGPEVDCELPHPPLPSPAEGWRTQCLTDGGTYSEGTDGWGYHCQWVAASPYGSDLGGVSTMNAVYGPLCSGSTGGSVSAPAWIGCDVP